MASTEQDKAKNSKTYRESAGEYYNQKYETWMPWIEDQYLRWFTKDNKASYATKRTFPTSSTSHQATVHHLRLPSAHSYPIQ